MNELFPKRYDVVQAALLVVQDAESSPKVIEAAGELIASSPARIESRQSPSRRGVVFGALTAFAGIALARETNLTDVGLAVGFVGDAIACVARVRWEAQRNS